MGTTVCNKINSFTNDLNDFKARLIETKNEFLNLYKIENIKNALVIDLETEIVTKKQNNDYDFEKKVYNTITNWNDPNYKNIFGVYNCEAEGPDEPGTHNLNCFERDIDEKIKLYNGLIKNVKDISGSRNEYEKFIDLLEKAQNTGDASEPRKKVRKQLLQNKNLLAFIYLSAILGGSYYIYRYLKN